MMYTQEQVLWMEQILEERYGFKITINKELNDSISLSIRNSKNRIYIVSDSKTFSKGEKNLSYSLWKNNKDWQMPLKKNLPLIGAKKLEKNDKVIHKSENHYFFNYDILGLLFWKLTRQEEIYHHELDEHNRFSASQSHADKHGYLFRPIVDEWLDILSQVIKKTWPNEKLKTNNYSLDLSHDVDNPSNFFFKSPASRLKFIAGDLFKRKDYKSALFGSCVSFISKNELSRNDPLNTFDWIMSESEKLGLKSTFYFVCGNSNKKLDPEYSIFDKPIISLMKRISERGHYIGLHPSYDSFENKQMIKKELVSLKEICDKENIEFRYQTRMHFLRWNQSKTLRILNDIGVKIDSSMGYADKVGFRAGTSFEYPAFDVLNNELLDIRIKPLIAMEVSMFSKKYMNLNNDKVLEVTKLLRDNCKRFGGKFSLLWHNNNLSKPIEKNLYSQIITERFKDA